MNADDWFVCAAAFCAAILIAAIVTAVVWS